MKSLLLPALLLLLPIFSLEARRPFHAEVSVDSESASVSATNLIDLSRGLKTESLEKLLPLYTPTSALSIGIDLRGIDILSFFAMNSNTLVVSIPQANITESFTGGTRDQSIALFREYLRDGGAKERLLKAYTRYSPIDPIAGNPQSLMAGIGDADYQLGRLFLTAGCDSCFPAQPLRHQIQLGGGYRRSFSQGFDGTAVNLPLRYSFSPDYRWAFILDAPLTFHDNGGAYSLFGSIGLGIRAPITDSWSLTPILRLGSGGTLDLATSGSFFSSGLTSAYTLPLLNGVFTLTNYAAYITSTNLWLTGINFNYRLQSYVFKNGLSYTTCNGFCVKGIPLDLNLYFIDSAFSNHRLFIDHYDEVGFSLITTGLNPCADKDAASLGFSYQFGSKGYKGYSLTFLYQY